MVSDRPGRVCVCIRERENVNACEGINVSIGLEMTMELQMIKPDIIWTDIMQFDEMSPQV